MFKKNKKKMKKDKKFITRLLMCIKVQKFQKM